jgi:hypothetical protein
MWLAGALALAVGAALAGCGGGGGDDGPSEDALRSKIEQGFKKVEEAKSVAVALGIRVGEGEEDDLLAGCFKFAIDKGGPSEDDDRLDMQAVENGCDGAAVSGEVIAVGPHVWLREGTGDWSAATVDPAALSELTDQSTDFAALPKAAEDLKEADQPDQAVYPERSEAFEGGTRYSFKAPASAFNQTEDAGDEDVDFETAFDDQGYLRELLATISVEDAEGVIKVTYDHVNKVPSIQPPPKSEVQGAPTQVHSKSELEALLAGPLGNAF